MSTSDSRLRLVVVYPQLLATYGDAGNGEILLRRAGWHGLDVELVEVAPGSPVPEQGDLYLLGGGEDEPQRLAAQELRQRSGTKEPALTRAVSNGAIVVGVCAGLQILGTSFPGADGGPVPGLGLLDARTVVGATRAVGDLVSAPCGEVSGLPVLLGFENHAGRTLLGPGTSELGRVEVGVGNDDATRTDGVLARVGAGLVVGTYMHGPLLALNPALADWLLGEATDGSLVVGERDDPAAEAAERLRSARLAALAQSRTHGRRGTR